MKDKRDEQHADHEARRRFERAVDIALHTPPMHREATTKPKKTAAKKSPKPKGG